MKQTLPSKKDWDISYIADDFASIFRTFSTDLYSYNNKIGASNRVFPYSVSNDSGLSTLTVPSKFIVSNAISSGAATYEALAIAERVYHATLLSSFVVDTITLSPSAMVDEDIITFGRDANGRDNLVVTKGTNLSRFNRDISSTTWDNNWWMELVSSGGLNQPALQSGVPHILLTFGNAPVLFILDGDRLHSVGFPGVGALQPTDVDVQNTRLKFRTGYYGNWMRATSYKIYIGLADVRGDSYPSLIEEYDPFNEQVREFVIEEGTTMGYIYNNAPIIIDYMGKLRFFNGSDFAVKNYFPTAFLTGEHIPLPHRNGMAVVDGKIVILFPMDNAKFYGGGWVYEPEFDKLYHALSLTQSKTDYRDAGTPFLTKAGALMQYQAIDGFFAGAEINLDYGGSAIRGIFSHAFVAQDVSSFNPPRASFTTGKLTSQDINSVWRNILTKYNARPFLRGLATGTIVVKTRTFDSALSSVNIYNGNWDSNISFDTATANANKINLGDEIFVYSGQGSGCSAHVVSKSAPSTGQVTVTLDEALPVLNFPNKGLLFEINNWTKLNPAQTSQLFNSYLFDVPSATDTQLFDQRAEWIQFKVEIRDGFFIEQLQVGSEIDLRVEKNFPPDGQGR